MNEELTKSWVQNVLGRLSFTGQRLLAWGAFRRHLADTVREELRISRVDTVIIPGGCTKYIQAPDVSWNKPFKKYVREKYDDWMADGIHEFTANGNMRGPPREMIVDWILAAWDSLDKQLVIDSFKHCALTVTTDDSEDAQIHCLKPSQPCAAGLDRLKGLNHVVPQEREDPFEGLTQSDEEDAVDEFHVVDIDEDEEGIDIDN